MNYSFHCRESLSACQDHLKSLQSQISELELRLAGQQDRANQDGRAGQTDQDESRPGPPVAGVGLLKGRLGRLIAETQREREVEKELVNSLKVRVKCKF